MNADRNQFVALVVLAPVCLVIRGNWLMEIVASVELSETPRSALADSNLDLGIRIAELELRVAFVAVVW